MRRRFELRSMKMNLFLRKIDMIQFLQDMYHYDYQEIAYILNDHPKVVEIYCDQIIGSEDTIKGIKKLKS